QAALERAHGDVDLDLEVRRVVAARVATLGELAQETATFQRFDEGVELARVRTALPAHGSQAFGTRAEITRDQRIFLGVRKEGWVPAQERVLCGRGALVEQGCDLVGGSGARGVR